MVDRTRVGELRQTTQLQPRATPVNSFNRAEEADLTKARRLEQLSSALDKVAGVTQDWSQAQFEQRSREKEADQVLLATRNFTNWSQGLDQSLWSLEPAQFQAALDQQFATFMQDKTDPNLKVAYTNMFADFYAQQVGRNADTFRERQQSDRMGLLTDRLWTAVRDPNLDDTQRNAAIEEVIAFGHNEYNLPRNVLNDWLVQQQFQMAKLPDQDENFAILKWMESQGLLNVGRYAEQVSYIQEQQATMDGLTAEVAKSQLYAEIEQRRANGQRSDRAFLDSYLRSNILTAAQVEAIQADDEKYFNDLATRRAQEGIATQGVNSIVGGNSGYALPANVQMDSDFTNAVDTWSQQTGLPAGWLYAIMALETGGTFNPAQPNGNNPRTVGLIQFMEKTATGLGTTPEALAAMSRQQQMAYVARFYQPYISQIRQASDLYVATFYPRALSEGDSFVIGSEVSPAMVAQIARENPALDADGDGQITKGEVAAVFNSSSHTAPFLSGQTSGIAGLPSQDIRMPDGTTYTVSQQRDDMAAGYSQRSAAIASASGETMEQQIDREIREFWGRTGGAIVNPQWKQALEAGYNLAVNQDGSGPHQNEVASMAYTLYRKMAANAPDMLSAYTSPEMRDFFETVSVYQDDLKQDLNASFTSARVAKAASGSPTAVEGRSQAVADIVDNNMFATSGWFWTNLGATQIGNMQQIQDATRRTVDRLLQLGLNPTQAETVAKRRIEQDYTAVGGNLMRTDNIQIVGYPQGGVAGFVRDMNIVKDMFGQDPVYKAYLEAQGTDPDEVTIIQSTTNDNQFFMLDGNFNPVPRMVEITNEDGQKEMVPDPLGGYLMFTTEMLPTLANEAWTSNLRRKLEAEEDDAAAAAQAQADQDAFWNALATGQSGYFDSAGAWHPINNAP